MKKLLFPVLILCISVTISCTKETITKETPAANSLTAASEENLISGGPHFGALIADMTASKKITVLNKLGVDYARSMIILKDFNGSSSLVDNYVKNGKKVILNLNYQRVVNKNPNPWLTDMAKYRNLLNDVLDKYADKIEVAVIENEPTVDLFHSGPIENYITMLGVAINACHAHGVKVADGAIHVENILDVMGGGGLSTNALEVKKLITAYATLDLDYVNIHTHGDGSSYPTNDLVKAADYVRNKTGHPVMSNEFSMHSYSASLVKDMVAGMKQGDYKYAIIFSGKSTSGAVPIQNGTDLLSNGQEYRDDIK